MIDIIDPSLSEWLLAFSAGFAAWAAKRIVAKVDSLDAKVDALSEQHVGFEATLKNGLAAQVKALEALISGHIEGEEERIMALASKHRRSDPVIIAARARRK